MIIESTLSRQEFIRHSLTRHFRRPAFYAYAAVGAVLLTYAFFNPDVPLLLYLAAVLPLLAYALGGWFAVIRRSRDESLPVYVPIRYEFAKSGIEVSSRLGRSVIPWEQLRAWRKVVGVYELALTNGQLLVISQRAVGVRQVGALEQLLNARITPKPEPGIFDRDG